jgi:hypothetical protein
MCYMYKVQRPCYEKSAAVVIFIIYCFFAILQAYTFELKVQSFKDLLNTICWCNTEYKLKF